MGKKPALRILSIICLAFGLGTFVSADPTPPDQGAQLPPGQLGAPPLSAQQAKPDHIAQLFNAWGPINGKDAKGNSVSGSVGVNEELRVKVAPAANSSVPQLDAKRYILFFNGRELKGLPDPVYDPKQQALVFELTRNGINKELWRSLLGSPLSWTVSVTVALGERLGDLNATPQPTITGTDGSDVLNLDVLPPWRLAIAIIVIGIVIWLLWAHARRNPILRDNLLPQIEPKQQTYSLGRWQMAFWFTLIFASFVFLFLLLWDPNTVSVQALTLMGISGATALAAVTVDAIKDSPADAVNRGLRALGLNSYDDVVRVRREIDDRQIELGNLSLTPQRRAQLNSEVQDRNNILRTYEDKIKPFKTQGWFNDITTDLNGTSIHRLQVFCWTWVLGGVFLLGVWRDLAMPEFSATLLALMGISSAGYVGFKYPEANN